jgi:hypothetical protein
MPSTGTPILTDPEGCVTPVLPERLRAGLQRRVRLVYDQERLTTGWAAEL